MALTFEWDGDKAIANERNHGVTFDEAATVFGNPDALTIFDAYHSTAKERFITIGFSHRSRVLVVVYTERERIFGSLVRGRRLRGNDDNMSNEMHNSSEQRADDLQAEYDFSGGVRGKHYFAYQHGYTVRIHKADGTVAEETYTPPPRTIVLDPDVFAYFSDSESVNRALRALIEVVPQKHSA